MFVRFRQKSPRKLQASLVETKRVNGKVQHEHIASLGSIATKPTIANRIDFFQKFEQRVATLTNRVDEETKKAITIAIAERIPIVTPADLKTLQIENAKAEADFWATLKASQDGQHAQQKALIAQLKRDLPDSRDAQVAITAQAKAARARLTKAKKGTLTGGLRKFDLAGLLKLGFSQSEIRRCQRVSKIHQMGADQELMDEIMKRHRSSELAAVRAVINRKTS
jgi:hypothetical protein